MKNTLLLVLVLCSVWMFPVALHAATPSPLGAMVYFITPQDGETVPETFDVVFGLTGRDVVPAGNNIPYAGHHHLLIDLDSLVDFSLPLPANSHIRHFDSGETQTRLTLPRGKHTLQLLLGDHRHIPHLKPVLSERITINVR
ncbi:DUF4399 domain-containing protein [Grimontia hollisae]|uniref:DUF4399 domain-containing protein n=1 Tax=Grimontia hollisae TaxID=673 RepID=UPI000E028864|nr:DUF4399 domain-containing protein [Grimontia hollisae]MDF2184781.1 DUF4399 domain-containing protein [Grimontia hollisae]STQ75858.1 Uncharacterised protein [Grimontia hollisae]